MDEAVAHTIQTVVGIIAVAAISIAILALRPTTQTEFFAVLGSSFSLIAAILGVHYSIRWVRTNGHGRHAGKD